MQRSVTAQTEQILVAASGPEDTHRVRPTLWLGSTLGVLDSTHCQAGREYKCPVWLGEC